MKQLIKHLLRDNIQEIKARSLLNCHVKGLHSIMLSEAPGKTIRLYVTTPDHELYRNYEEAETLAYHPHHSNITLHSVYGDVTDINMKVVNDISDNSTKLFNRWLYNSQIISETPVGFVLDGEDVLVPHTTTKIITGNSVFLNAQDIHTVACRENSVNAWMVYEGKESPNYKPYAWSNQDLSTIECKNLYQKPKEEQILELLSSVNLI